MLIKTAAGGVFWTIVVFLSATGLLRQNSGQVVEPTAVWAGIVGGLAASMWGFLQTDFQRSDWGLRTDRLPSLLLLAVPLSAAIQLAAMMLWPLMIDSPIGSLISEFHSDPTAVLQAALFLLAMMSWSMTAMFGFARGGPLHGILSGVLLLAALGLGIWQGIVLLENPVEPGRTVLWGVLAALGLATMTVVAALTGKANPRAQSSIQ